MKHPPLCFSYLWGDQNYLRVPKSLKQGTKPDNDQGTTPDAWRQFCISKGATAVKRGNHFTSWQLWDTCTSCAGDLITSSWRAPGWLLPSAFTREGNAPHSQLGESFALHTFSLTLGCDLHTVIEEVVSIRQEQRILSALDCAGWGWSTASSARPGPSMGPARPRSRSRRGRKGGTRPSQKEQRPPRSPPTCPGPEHLGSDPSPGSAAENTPVTDRLLSVLSNYSLLHTGTQSV